MYVALPLIFSWRYGTIKKRAHARRCSAFEALSRRIVIAGASSDPVRRAAGAAAPALSKRACLVQTSRTASPNRTPTASAETPALADPIALVFNDRSGSRGVGEGPHATRRASAARAATHAARRNNSTPGGVPPQLDGGEARVGRGELARRGRRRRLSSPAHRPPSATEPRSSGPVPRPTAHARFTSSPSSRARWLDWPW